jgi:hypothetical protein
MHDRYTLAELEATPTINQGHTADLKFDTPRRRVWLERTTVADGEPYDHAVTIEEYDGNAWRQVERYPATTDAESAAAAFDRATGEGRR